MYNQHRRKTFVVERVSFTCPVRWSYWTMFHLDLSVALSRELPGVEDIINFLRFERRVEVPARRPYICTLTHWESGARMYYHPKMSHVLFDLPGKACQWVREKTSMTTLLDVVKHRLTRLDVALDIETDLTPSDLACVAEATTTRGKIEITSDAGDTFYIGSPKSGHVKIYKHNDPQSKSEVLRVQFVARRGVAKTLAKNICNNGLQAVGQSLMSKYSLASVFEFEEEDPSTPEEDPSIQAESREHAKTLLWLNKQVAPTLVRLARAGALNPRDWLDKEVLSKLDSTRK